MKAYKSEKEFLANYDIRDFDVPLVTVDMAILTVKADALCVLAVKRSEFPKQGRWALPGGFIDLARDRTIEEAARRKLAEKTGVDTAHMEQVITVGNKKRDPRGWSITIVYMALVAADQLSQASSASADEISWVPVDSVAEKCKLAFDHQDLLAHCVERLRTKSTYTWLPSNLMPELFTLTELQHTFEIVIGRKVDAKSFRRRILDAQLVEETGRSKLSGRRHAQLFRISSIGSEYVFSRTMEGSRS